jgi:hypothetical protein
LQIGVSHVASDNCKAPTISSFFVVLQYVSSLDLVCFRGFLKIVIKARRRIPLMENQTITRSVLVRGHCKTKVRPYPEGVRACDPSAKPDVLVHRGCAW